MAYVFHGYDWTELAECFEIGPFEEPFDEADPEGWAKREDARELQQLENLKDFLWSHREDPAVERAMRTFLKTAARESLSFEAPVWRGLLKVKNSSTFARYYCELLPFFWT